MRTAFDQELDGPDAYRDQAPPVAPPPPTPDRGYREPIPRVVGFSGSGVFPSSGNQLIVMTNPGPPAGFLWHVKSLRFVGGIGATTAPAGVGYVFVGAQGRVDSLDISGQWVDKSSSPFPVAAFYGDYELPVIYPAVVYALIVGGTSAVVYTFSGVAKQVPDTAHAAGESYRL